MWFNWQGHRQSGDSIRFYDLDPLTFTATKAYWWEAILMTNYILSKQEYEGFEWEIQLKSTSGHPEFIVMLSFVDASIPKLSEVPIGNFFNNFDHSPVNEAVKLYLVHLYSMDYPRCLLSGGAGPTEIDKMDEIKPNDRIKLFFDFTKGECHFNTPE